MQNRRAVDAEAKFKDPPSIMGSQFTETDIEDAKANCRILSVSLLLSNACNLKCVYCYRDAGALSNDLLSINEWRDVLLQAKSLGARTVRIPGSGEPLLDPAFYNGYSLPLIEFSNSIGLSVTFFTNGTLLTSELAVILRNYDVCVVTKLNSFRPEIQDELAGVRGASERIMRGLEFLIKAGFARESPTRLGIDTVIVSDNYDEIPKLFLYCRERNIVPYITVNLHGGRARTNTKLDVPRQWLRSLFEHLLTIDRTKFGFEWFPSPPIVADQCNRLLYDIVIDYKGNVLVCPGIEHVIGNIRNNSLSQILKSSPFLSRVRRMPDSLKGKCRTCSSKKCIYGCRLEAWSHGDFFGPDPMCWYEGD